MTGEAAWFLAIALSAMVAHDDPADPVRPLIRDCARRGVVGDQVCVCGTFPSGSWDALTLDGRPWRDRVNATSRVVVLRIPEGLSPGLHVIGGDPAFGFTPADQMAFSALRVGARLERDPIVRGQGTTFTVEVEGSADAMELRLLNAGPRVASLEGGEEQAALTSGGSPNRLARTVRGRRRGDFRIGYALADPLCACASDEPAPGLAASEPPPVFLPGRVLALIAHGPRPSMEALARTIAATHGLTVLEVHDLASIGEGLIVFGTAPGDVLTKVASLRRDTRVRAAQPDFRYETTGGATEVGQPLEYGRGLIGADRLPGATRGEGITVAVIDTGVDVGHPALKGRMAGQVDVTGQGFTPDVHGTLVAGIIGAEPGGLGMQGVAPGVRLLAVKACQPASPQAVRGVCSSASLARGVDAALGGGARLLNLSVAGPARDDLLVRMVDHAVGGGRVVVAGAGHRSAEAPGPFPAALPNVLAVTAVGPREEPYPPATRGTFIDVAAPGVEIVSTVPGGRVAVFSGTSAAAAFVSGSVALVLQQASGLEPAEVQEAIEGSARDLGTPGKDPQFGSGLLNAPGAVERARSPRKRAVP